MATFTPEQKKEYRRQKQEEQRELLENAVDRFMTSDGFREYLDTRAKFHKYSFYNSILIALQRPDATQVMGKKQWAKNFERTLIEDDDQPIHILAPQITYEKDNKGNIIKDDKGKNVIRFIWYKTVQVYDVAQTEGEDLPEAPEEFAIKSNEHEEWLLRLQNYATSVSTYISGIPHDEAIDDQVYVLAREIAKAKTAGEDHRDVIAEAVAYLVCRLVGLDTSGVVIPHIATIEAESDKERMKSLKEFAGRIDEITDEILEGVRA